VQHLFAVQELHCFEHLLDDAARVLLGVISGLLDDLTEHFAVHLLEHEVHRVIGIELLQQLDNVRVLRDLLQDVRVLFALFGGDETLMATSPLPALALPDLTMEPKPLLCTVNHQATTLHLQSSKEREREVRVGNLDFLMIIES
jgi:hypothetical protein